MRSKMRKGSRGTEPAGLAEELKMQALEEAIRP
jgi:hypothetical protein